MYSVKDINSFFRQDVLETAHFFTHRLQHFVAPLLSELDKLLDKRLVYTFKGLCESLLRLRNKPTSLVLSELRAYLLSPDKAPAGTKRISTLLRSKKWQDQLIVDYLAGKAQVYAQELLDKKEPVLLLWDESVQEKTESIESEGLCAVRSTKAKRLLRRKKGYYDPPTHKAVHVPGIRWVALLLTGMYSPPQVARFRWWTSRGHHLSWLRQVRFELLLWARECFGSAVLHVFDRGYAGAPWLGLLLAKQDRFLMRWPSAYKLVLVYSFLLSLLDKQQEEKIKTLLRYGCHRTGKRCKENLYTALPHQISFDQSLEFLQDGILIKFGMIHVWAYGKTNCNSSKPNKVKLFDHREALNEKDTGMELLGIIIALAHSFGMQGGTGPESR